MARVNRKDFLKRLLISDRSSEREKVFITREAAEQALMKMKGVQVMERYDKDIEENLYLSEHGKYVAQFARNHNIPISEAHEHPTVKAHKEMHNHLMECMDFHNGTMALKQMER